MTGTLVNVGAVLAGTAVGVLAGPRVPDGVRERVLMALGLLTLVLGVDLALGGEAGLVYPFLAVLVGAVAGELLAVERRLEALGDRVQARVSAREGSTVSEGFVTASLLFCIGPLAIIGAIEDGLRGDVNSLLVKSLLDGFASVALAASLGWGVALAAGSVLLYQGSITLAAGALEPVLGDVALDALFSTGGVLVLGISLKLLGLLDVKVGNFLPALVVAPALVAAAQALGID